MGLVGGGAGGNGLGRRPPGIGNGSGIGPRGRCADAGNRDGDGSCENHGTREKLGCVDTVSMPIA
jgi:hypothetical protein